MTNLDQVCLFSNLTAIPVQWCVFWVGVVGPQLFFAGFKVGIYWEMIEISKEIGKSKRGRIKYQGGAFFSFLSINTFCHILFLFLQIPILK